MDKIGVVNMLNKAPASIYLDNKMFSINKKIEIVVDNDKKYIAVIIAKVHKGIIIELVGGPLSNKIKLGNSIKYFIESGNEKEQDFYCCFSIVTGIKQDQTGVYVGLSYPEKIERIGGRSFFRMTMEMKVFYRILNAKLHYENIEDIPERYFNSMYDAFTTNISGNGMKILIEERCEKGQEVAIVIPELNNMKILGIVQWLEPINISNKTRIALSFKNIKVKQQDEIISHMFSKMRENKSREYVPKWG
jgi:hypothetical protein